MEENNILCVHCLAALGDYCMPYLVWLNLDLRGRLQDLAFVFLLLLILSIIIILLCVIWS